MKLSVIIITLNEAETIGTLLQNIAAQTRQADEVLVIDGGSSDATKKILKKYKKVRFLESEKGPGRQRSYGGSKAIGDYLIFLDADVALRPDFFEQLLNAAQSQKLECAIPKYIPQTKDLRVRLLFSVLNMLFTIGVDHFPAGAGPCIYVSKKRFLQLGGFSSQLLVDDLDFVHRAGMLGNFAVLPYKVVVSARRFEKYGFWKTCWQYLIISWHFIKQHNQDSNQLEYSFGEYSQANQPK